MQLPPEVPVMTLPEVILFPQAMLPLHIFEPRYRRMLKDALTSHRMFSVAMQKPGRVREAPSTIAGLGLIRASVANKNGTSNLILQGIARIELAEAVQYRPYRVHSIRPLESKLHESVMVDALVAKVRDLVAERLTQGFHPPPQVLKKFGPPAEAEATAPTEPLTRYTMEHILKYLAELEDADQLADIVSGTLLMVPAERQVILETFDVEARLKHLVHFLMAEIQRHRKPSAS